MHQFTAGFCACSHSSIIFATSIIDQSVCDSPLWCQNCGAPCRP